jgi:L-iditol 2-dehydrogenase
MRAWVLHDIGDIRMEETERPHPGRGEVLLSVKAAGICGSDIPRIYTTGAHRHPLIPGHEFAGSVEALGEGVEAGWLGKSVGVFPLLPCGQCHPCRNRQYEMCRNYSYLGSRKNGGFAEYVAVPVENLIVLPQGVSFEEAAMLEPMAVAVHAMRRIRLKEANTVAVCGLGTIGIMLLQFLMEAWKTQGCGTENIYVIGNKEFQRQQIVKLGLPESCFCDGSQQDMSNWLMERTNGRGADLFFECVGKNETLMQAVDNTAPAGQICLVGNPASNMLLEQKVYWKILRNQLMLTGTWNSSFLHEETDDWHYVLDRLSWNQVKPDRFITHRLALEELEQGLHIMRDKREDYVKIMVTMD